MTNNIIDIDHRASPNEIGKTLTENNPEYIRVPHSLEYPKDTNLLLMARRDIQAKTCITELAKSGYYLCDANEDSSKLIRSDLIKTTQTTGAAEKFRTTRREVIYSFQRPQTGVKPKRMLVVLSSIHTEFNSPKLHRYFMQNFRKVQDYIPHDTAILRIGDLGGIVGSFYMNTTHRPKNEFAIQKLIRWKMKEHDIGPDAVVLYGASKGGTAALYHGIKGGYRYISVDPIVSDDYYVKNLSDAHFTTGGIFQRTKDAAFERLFNKSGRTLNGSKGTVICSESSEQFPYIHKSLIQNFQDRITFFKALDPRIKSHPDVSVKTLNCATMLMNMHLYGIHVTPGINNMG